jgi:hypothetical protein
MLVGWAADLHARALLLLGKAEARATGRLLGASWPRPGGTSSCWGG